MDVETKWIRMALHRDSCIVSLVMKIIVESATHKDNRSEWIKRDRLNKLIKRNKR